MGAIAMSFDCASTRGRDWARRFFRTDRSTDRQRAGELELTQEHF